MGRERSGQAFSALRDTPKEAFRSSHGEVLYKIVFLGEYAHDAGGEWVDLPSS